MLLIYPSSIIYPSSLGSLQSNRELLWADETLLTRGPEGFSASLCQSQAYNSLPKNERPLGTIQELWFECNSFKMSQAVISEWNALCGISAGRLPTASESVNRWQSASHQRDCTVITATTLTPVSLRCWLQAPQSKHPALSVILRLHQLPT